jgi:hypothetical protein
MLNIEHVLRKITFYFFFFDRKNNLLLKNNEIHNFHYKVFNLHYSIKIDHVNICIYTQTMTPILKRY